MKGRDNKAKQTAQLCHISISGPGQARREAGAAGRSQVA
jgi:hypothetical protein